MDRLVEGIWQIVEKHIGHKIYNSSRPNCFLCLFHSPMADNPHSFWADLWSYLQKNGVDTLAFRTSLHARAMRELKSGGYECTPYMTADFLREIVELVWQANRFAGVKAR